MALRERCCGLILSLIAPSPVLRDANWIARPNTDEQLRQKSYHFDARGLGEIAPARYGESFAEQRQLCHPTCSEIAVICVSVTGLPG